MSVSRDGFEEFLACISELAAYIERTRITWVCTGGHNINATAIGQNTINLYIWATLRATRADLNHGHGFVECAIHLWVAKYLR